jgi:hypothetical protein
LAVYEWISDKFVDCVISAGLRGMAAEHQLANADVTAKMAYGFSHIPARYWCHRAIRARIFWSAQLQSGNGEV